MLMMLAEPEQRLVINEEKLQSLLNIAVAVTKGQTVEKLEMLWSRVSQGIYMHRMDYNKELLLEVSYLINMLVPVSVIEVRPMSHDPMSAEIVLFLCI